MKYSRKVKKNKNVKKSRKLHNNKLVIGGVCKECELNNKKIKELELKDDELDDEVSDIDSLILAYKFYKKREFDFYFDIEDGCIYQFEICKIKNFENKNKNDYDYSQFNISKFISYPQKEYNTINELMKNVFLIVTPYPQGTIERNKLTLENPVIFSKMIKNEKICIHSCFTQRPFRQNNYANCELLITTYGKLLYNISHYGEGIGYSIELKFSETNLNEFAFFLSNQNINLLKCILNSFDSLQMTDQDQVKGFDNLIKNIINALKTMKNENKYIKEVEDCLIKNIEYLEDTKDYVKERIKEREEEHDKFWGEISELKKNKKISNEDVAKENVEKENEIVDDSVYGL